MNSTYLLRIEGVNLSHFILDTRDLSTIRGGGLALLKAIERAEALLQSATGVVQDSVKAISKGASVGLFQFEVTAGADLEEIRSSVAGINTRSDTPPPNPNSWDENAWLTETLPHATHVVDIVPLPDVKAFGEAHESLIAANRWRQMAASSLSLPASQGDEICQLDGIRPKDVSLNLTEKRGIEESVSRSVLARRRYGQRRKKTFYGDFTASCSEHEFADDFEQIAAGHPGGLSGKMAIFYADGNGFGKIQAEHCTSIQVQESFDDYVRTQRKAFMTHFLETELFREPEWLNPQKGPNSVYRFETLLWGGDELMFVMPAWKGWRFAQLFFKHFENFVFAPDQNTKIPLTQAAALVFCHHHAPIHRIKRLAKDQMAEFCKKHGPAHNSLFTVALESFDHLGTDLETALQRRYRGVVPASEMILKPVNGKPLHEVLSGIGKIHQLRTADNFPRKQLRQLVQEMLDTGDSTKAGSLAEVKVSQPSAADSVQLPRHFRNVSDIHRDLLGKTLKPLFPSDSVLWLQMEEIWEYAIP